MKKNKTLISKAKTIEEIGNYWDSHDASEILEKNDAVEFETDIKSEVTYYAIESKLAKNLKKISRKHGVPASTLINIWLQEKISESM